LLRNLGIRETIDYISRFGFDKNKLPANLSLSLGSAALTPLSIARGYAVFANGGHLIEPYFIERIEDADGNIIFQAKPKDICHNCPVTKIPPHDDSILPKTTETAEKPTTVPRIISNSNAYLITSILKDVIQRGTGRRARILKRNDLSGKTGTTNDQLDAWFSGFNQHIVTTVWVGFDQPKTLGRRETGGRAALPIWIDFMRVALEKIPQTTTPQPENIVAVRIDPKNGLLAKPNQENALFEIFETTTIPRKMSESNLSSDAEEKERHNIEAELF